MKDSTLLVFHFKLRNLPPWNTSHAYREVHCYGSLSNLEKLDYGPGLKNKQTNKKLIMREKKAQDFHS